MTDEDIKNYRLSESPWGLLLIIDIKELGLVCKASMADPSNATPFGIFLKCVLQEGRFGYGI